MNAVQAREITDANFPMDGEGRTYHVGLKAGQCANRIVLVGDKSRALRISNACFDDPNCFSYTSEREFTSLTGKVNGVAVTIMAIGMGGPMMDFAVREIRAITEGPLAIIRCGSCGTPKAHMKPTDVAVAAQSVYIQTNYDAFRSESSEASYKIHKPVSADPKLHSLLVNALKDISHDTFGVHEGTDVTAETFYAAQGRDDPTFCDKNKGLVDSVVAAFPDAVSLQMETFFLLDLADREAAKNIHAAGCAIIFANRVDNSFIKTEDKHAMEIKAGTACVNAVVNFPL